MKKVLNVCEGVSGASMTVVVALTMLQAIMRSFADKGLSWTNEALFMSQIMLVYFIIPVLFYEKENIRVDVFVNRFPSKVIHVFLIVSEIISLIFCIIFFVSITLFLIKTWKNATPIMKIPNGLFYGSVWVGMFFSVLCTLLNIINMIVKKEENQWRE